MKRTPLKRVSAAELRTYHGLKKLKLMLHPYCECPSRTGAPSCMNPATELHHLRGSAGSLLTDERYIMPICRACHRWIHDHSKQARQMKLLQ